MQQASRCEWRDTRKTLIDFTPESGLEQAPTDGDTIA
jgi:hypothetical protein